MLKQQIHSRSLNLCMVVLLFCIAIGTVWSQNMNDWAYNPFNGNSAFHRPVGTGAQYADDSHEVTKLWKSLGSSKFYINNPYPHGSPFGVVKPTDPEITITYDHCPKWNDRRPELFPITLRVPPPEVFPANFKIGVQCSDATVLIYDPSTAKIREFSEYVNWGNRKITAAVFRVYDINGLGHGSKLNERVGTSASGISLLGGAVRAWEIETPGHKISHAFQMVVPGFTSATELTKLPFVLGKKVQWPAVGGDNGATQAKNNLGPVPYGALLAIPPVNKGGPDLTKMKLSEPGLRFAEALRDYGLFIVDNGGGLAFRAAEPIGGTAGNQVRDDIKKICPHLRMILNSVTGATATITTSGVSGSIGKPTWPAGGGTPLAPNTAIDAGSITLGSAVATNATTIVVSFYGELEKTSAENKANYTLNGGASVTSAIMQSDKSSVKLTVSSLSAQEYTLNVKNVKSAKGETMKSASVTFKHPAFVIDSLATFSNYIVRIRYSMATNESAENMANYSLMNQTTNTAISLARMTPSAGWLFLYAPSNSIVAGSRYKLSISNVKSAEYSIALGNPEIEFTVDGTSIISHPLGNFRQGHAITGKVRVYDHSGRVVATGSELSALREKLPNGVYYVRQGGNVKSSMVVMR